LSRVDVNQKEIIERKLYSLHPYFELLFNLILFIRDFTLVFTEKVFGELSPPQKQ